MMKMEYFKDSYLNKNEELKILDVGSFDKTGTYNYKMVVTGQALEHMEFFWLTMEQINKVLKPGGLCCIIVPSTGPVHRNPYDCYRFNEDGVRSLAKYVKFEILESGTTTDKISDPWYDSFVIARKPGPGSKGDLENRMDDIEQKMDLILEKLQG